MHATRTRLPTLGADALLTTHDVATLVQVSPSAVVKWIDAGKLAAFRTPGGHRRVRAATLRLFLADHQMPVPTQLSNL